MKKLFVVFVSIYFAATCCAQTTKEQKFKIAVQDIVTAFSKQDMDKFSKYIDDAIGVYQAYKIGSFGNFGHYKKIDFSDTSYPFVLYSNLKGIIISTINYTSLPTWDCNNEAWSKQGLFVDTIKTDHLLSKICTERNELRPDTIAVKQIDFFYELETKSRRIVLNDLNGKELIFYLTYIKNKWRLTIIDNISSDCSV